MFGGIISYIDLQTPKSIEKDVFASIKSIHNYSKSDRYQLGQISSNLVQGNHNYEKRMDAFLKMHTEIRKSGDYSRHAKLKLGVLLPSEVASRSLTSDSTIAPMLKTLQYAYSVTYKSLVECELDLKWFYDFDLVLVAGDFGSDVDEFVRLNRNEWPRKWTTNKQLPQMRMLLQSGPIDDNNNVTKGELMAKYI